MIDVVLVVVLSILGGILGVCLHELAHLIGFRLCGLRAWFRWPSIEDGQLVPKTAFEPSSSLGARVGALAPVLVGVALVPVFVSVVLATGSQLVLAALTMCWIWTTKPSRRDLSVALGRQR